MTVLQPDWLDAPRVQKLLRAFSAHDIPVRFVGGAVRDSLLGLPVYDLDLCTPSLPHDTLRLLEAEGIKVIPTGLQHGTVTAAIDGQHFEITTLRIDTSCNGRHAEVVYTDNWQEDAARRDFTINALSLEPDGTVHDYFNGLADIHQQRIRFIGDPVARIREDYLRILRFFRFQATRGRAPADEAALVACSTEKQGLSGLSAERIATELSKLMAASAPSYAVQTMHEAGVAHMVLGFTPELGSLERLLAIERGLPIARTSWLLRLAVMIRQLDEPTNHAKRLAEALKLSKQDTADLIRYADYPLQSAMPELQEMKTLVYRYGNEDATAFFLLAATDTEALAENIRLQFLTIRNWRSPKFPVTGTDLKTRGIRSGPEMGNILKILERKWIESGFSLTGDELLRTV
jgi:poly(A) polymerase